MGLAEHPIAHPHPCEWKKMAKLTCEDDKEEEVHLKMMWGQRWEKALSLVVFGYNPLATISAEKEFYQGLRSHH